MSEEMMNDELREMERALAAFRPAGHALGREELLMRAGAARERRRSTRMIRCWQGACAALVVCCVGVSMLAARRPEAGAPEGSPGLQFVRTPETEKAPPFVLTLFAPEAGLANDVRAAAVGTDYLHLRREVLAAGVGALGTQAPVGAMRATGARGPALGRNDGFDSLPVWQQQQALFTGGRS